MEKMSEYRMETHHDDDVLIIAFLLPFETVVVVVKNASLHARPHFIYLFAASKVGKANS